MDILHSLQGEHRVVIKKVRGSEGLEQKGGRALTNKKLKQLRTFGQAKQIAAEEIQRYKDELFAQNASEILQQVMAGVLITLEKCYGWKGKRLKDFCDAMKMYLDIMQNPDYLYEKWDNMDNIEYIKSEYGIDLREMFRAEVQCER